MKRSPRMLALVGASTLLFAAPTAIAAPTDVTVRVEGLEKTVFEQKVTTDGHLIKLASEAEPHLCDGRNAGADTESGPTATSALDDASKLGKFDWQGKFYPSMDDFLIAGIGPEINDTVSGRYWTLLLNGKMASKGGCQLRVHQGDEVLLAYDGFRFKRKLHLSGPATAKVGEPVTVKVVDTAVKGGPAEGTPVEGAVVNGQKSAADGTVKFVFSEAGTQTFKATADGALRSNATTIEVMRP